MKTFVILGMHRSATSLVGQGLAKSGIQMGDRLLGIHPSNPYGHWEDIDFIHFNDKILSACGGAWNNPPKARTIYEYGQDNKKEIAEFIAMKEREPFWGWKDPRTTLTIRCYMPHLKNPHFIACHRNPRDVAKSLNKRDNMPIDKGLMLANIYNHRMNSFLKDWYASCLN